MHVASAVSLMRRVLALGMRADFFGTFAQAGNSCCSGGNTTCEYFATQPQLANTLSINAHAK